MVRFLLDTHTFIWFILDARQLSSVVKTIIEDTNHHRDPFDRLLITQSLSEKLPILSRDATFDHYAVQRIWTQDPSSE